MELSSPTNLIRLLPTLALPFFLTLLFRNTSIAIVLLIFVLIFRPQGILGERLAGGEKA